MPRFYLTTPPKSVTYVLNLLCYLCSEPAPTSKPLWRIATRVVVCKRGQRTRFKNSNADLQASISFARLLDHFGDRILHQHRRTDRASRRHAQRSRRDIRFQRWEARNRRERRDSLVWRICSPSHPGSDSSCHTCSFCGRDFSTAPETPSPCPAIKGLTKLGDRTWSQS